jgi:hypothetical protein
VCGWYFGSVWVRGFVLDGWVVVRISGLVGSVCWMARIELIRLGSMLRLNSVVMESVDVTVCDHGDM